MRSVYLALTGADQKDDGLLAGRDPSGSNRFVVDHAQFVAVPGSPFSYRISPALRELFRSGEAFEANGRVVRSGMQTSDDFRFLRAWWEPFSRSGGWVPYAKGDGSDRFYADVPTCVRWGDDGAALKAFAEETPGTTHWSRYLKSTDFYFRPGITWPLRARRFSPRPLPAGSIFSVRGYALFAPEGDLSVVLGLAVGGAIDALFKVCLGRAGYPEFVTGVLRRLPWPTDLPDPASDRLAHLARRGWSARRSLDTLNEVSHAFVVPAVLQVAGDTFGSRVAAWAARVSNAESELARVQSEIDELCFELYGISEVDRRAITEGFGLSDSDDADDDSDGVDATESEVLLDPVGLAAALVSWAVGVAAGRFDVRLATGERGWPVEPDPFDPLPVCSPGMLTGDDGLPVVSLPDGYPVVPSPVLVDDSGHELDLTARVRAVFDVVFGEHADVWWSDVGAALDARNGVEGWLRRGFFDQHLKTYSKSRRKAPIIWPIGTRSGSYRVWLYAHQVTGDTVFRVLGDVVEPKLASEQRRLSDLMQEFGPSPSGSQRRTLDAQQALVDELNELRDELRAVAPLWQPDLNDGIVIVLAPLWCLFAHHRAWSKELQDRWAKLAKGEYDWAQLAMHIWPERVIAKCAVDRSLAIAHDLEDTFWAHDDTNPDKWNSRHTPTTPIVQLIANRTNPTIQTARTHPTP